jgi:hypothetical protein
MTMVKTLIIILMMLFIRIGSYGQLSHKQLEVSVISYTTNTATIWFTNPNTTSVSFDPTLTLGEYLYERDTKNKVKVGANSVVSLTFTIANSPNPNENSKYKILIEIGCQGASPNCIVYEKYIYYTPPSSLPVELISFNVKARVDYNLLEWETASEVDSKHFEIQRSENGIEFISVAQVNAAGYSSIKLKYTYNDYLKPNNLAYYRLKQIDIDGSFEFSRMVIINPPKKPIDYYGFSIYYDEIPERIIVYDLSGRNILTDKNLTLKPPEFKLGSGAYVIVLITNKSKYTKKIQVK